MDFSKYSFRSHSFGNIMVNPRGKSPMQKYLELQEQLEKKRYEYDNLANQSTKTAQKLEQWIVEKSKESIELRKHKDDLWLSTTCKKYLAELRLCEKYGRVKDVKSRFMEKGLYCEEDAITEYSLFLGRFLKKNKVRKNNGFVNGEADIDDEEFDAVHDTKSCWDLFSFGKNAVESLPAINVWQGRCYMWLYDRSQAYIVKVLLDTPEHLRLVEEKKLVYDIFGSYDNLNIATVDEKMWYEEALSDLRKNHIFGDIPREERIIVKRIERDDTLEKEMQKRVEDCRQYMTMLEEGYIEADDYYEQEEN